MSVPIDFGDSDDAVINILINKELEEFIADIDIHPAPNLQYLRSGLIALFSRFYPEAISKEMKEKIISSTTNFISEPTYDDTLWYRILFLNVATQSFTKEDTFLRSLILNLDHHKSQLRLIIHPALALCAPDLKTNVPQLISVIRSNFQLAHFYNKNLLCILCSLPISLDNKIEIVNNILDQDNLSTQDTEDLKALIKNRGIENLIIANDLSEICRYSLCRLLAYKSSTQLPLSPFAIYFSDLTTSPVSIMWERMQHHPLINTYIKVE